jgi:flagellar basal body-associated protein FliL
MKMLTDEQIFDILDGFATKEIMAQHHNLLSKSAEYKTYFEDLEAIHLNLLALPIEKPSVQFTENILANIAYAQVKKNSWSSQLTWIFFTIMLVFFVGTISLALFYFSNSNSFIEIPKVKNMGVINTFHIEILVKVLILGNLIVLLAIFDKKILKPYFLNKKIRLS